MPKHLGALADIIQRTFGVATRTRVSDAGATIGVAISTILRQNPNRLAATIINLGGSAIYVAPLGAPSATRGIRLAPTGGSVILKWDEDFDVLGYEWAAIADAAGIAYFAIEIIADIPEEG